MMPAGDEVTLPLPLPANATASVYVSIAKLAVTDAGAPIATVHVVAVPLHTPPDQPVKW